MERIRRNAKLLKAELEYFAVRMLLFILELTSRSVTRLMHDRPVRLYPLLAQKDEQTLVDMLLVFEVLVYLTGRPPLPVSLFVDTLWTYSGQNFH